MKRCAFLTLRDPGGYVAIDDVLAHGPLRDLGWEAEDIPWDRPGVDWSRYDVVVIRSTWDYHRRLDEFLGVLDEIERAGVRIENSPALVRWNVRKTYLRDLASRGVPVVPTVWRDRLRRDDVPSLFDELGTGDIVAKPVVGASAEGAFRLRRDSPVAEAAKYFAGRALMAQPFARHICDDGEYSLVYLGGEFSHATRKTPKERDFRVQEEHGGTFRAVVAGADLRAAADAAMDGLETVPLYARVDMVRANDGDGWWLMEFELVEPSLYLRMDPDAPARLAGAIASRG